MIPPRRHRAPEESVDSWLMSYADLITLLLCFFIIFVSVSEPKKDRMHAITDGMAGKFGGTLDLNTPFTGLYQELQATIEEHSLLRDVAIIKTPGGVEMELASGAFFRPGSAELDEEKIPALTEMAAAIAKLPDGNWRAEAEGHTSDVPIHTGLFPSNWEFSGARASRVVRFFIEQNLKPERFKSVAYADTKPSVPNLDAGGHAIVQNRNQNQRIVLKIEKLL